MLKDVSKFLSEFKEKKLRDMELQSERKNAKRYQEQLKFNREYAKRERQRKEEFVNCLILQQKKRMKVEERSIFTRFSIRIYGNPLIEDEPQERELYNSREELQWAEENDPNETGSIQWSNWDKIVKRFRHENGLEDNG